MMEEWKGIDKYDGLYQVSNYGRVKSLKFGKERIMKLINHLDGYLAVGLYKNGKQKWYLVHRLVAQAFIPNPSKLPMINHKDENPLNNNVDNLEWCNAKYNLNYNEGQKRKAMKRSKTIYQYTLNGEFVREWLSATEVQRQTGYNQGHICQCCNGKYKTANGFIWRYKFL